ncbi:MAG: hypothetical protein EPN97_16170 [Alphaproteobacteria bacterium]|nr:MAG: hypothetical protein EPN97_16170 [Alphaproteobacteria bacterium]
MSDSQPANGALRKLFPWLASLVLFVSAMLIGYTMEQTTKTGDVCWYTYPAFMLLTVVILAANHFIYPDERG